MGRPLTDIDAEEVFKLAQLGCKVREIADYFGCNEDTIHRRFAEELDKGRTMLKMSIRRLQIQSAQKGNIAMQIWLGKQMLGQMERSHIELTKIPDELFLAEAQRRLLDGPSEPSSS